MAIEMLVSLIETCSLNDERKKLRPFENEYATLSELHDKKNLMKDILKCLDDLKPNGSIKSTETSDRHREEGNRLFRASKKLNALSASRHYTNAILAAPDSGTTLALAHANRAAALAEFGYYSQAFDDCQCAQDFGYPQEQLEKIVMRQAYCASKLESFEKLSECLVKLRDLNLSEPFVKQKCKFEEDLIELEKQNDHKTSPINTEDLKIQTISVDPKRGRCMIATKDIPERETILIEKAFALVPVDEAKICSNCALEQLIPFPCNVCSKVVYCSLDCKNSHREIHKYECYAYRCDLFEALGITHLALNTLINGIPSIVNDIKQCKSGKEVWQIIEGISKSGSRGYAEILSLVTHLDKVNGDFVRTFGISSTILAYYLLKRTPFFELFQECTCDPAELITVVSALILRHATQMIANAQSIVAIAYIEKSYDFLALSDIWIKPQHLKKGLLHKFHSTNTIYSGIFPYLSLCNHSCEPSLRLNFNGNTVIASASHNLSQGTEICNSYTLDYRKASRSNRQEQLLEMHHFKCECHRCSMDERDEIYPNFHKYKCANSMCQAIFSAANDPNLHWWLEDDGLDNLLKCPHCGTVIEVYWYLEFLLLLQSPKLDLIEISKLLKQTEKYLIDHNSLRYYMASEVVAAFFKQCTDDKMPALETDFVEVANLIKYCLDYAECRCDVESILYVITTAFALDLMAEGQYFDCDLDKMKRSFDVLPSELRIVFDNYIEDFIGDKFTNEMSVT